MKRKCSDVMKTEDGESKKRVLIIMSIEIDNSYRILFIKEGNVIKGLKEIHQKEKVKREYGKEIRSSTHTIKIKYSPKRKNKKNKKEFKTFNRFSLINSKI